MIIGLIKNIGVFNQNFNKDSEALSNKLFKAVAQREKVDPIPIEKMIYIPTNQRRGKTEKFDSTIQTDDAKDEKDDHMVTVEKEK